MRAKFPTEHDMIANGVDPGRGVSTLVCLSTRTAGLAHGLARTSRYGLARISVSTVVWSPSGVALVKSRQHPNTSTYLVRFAFGIGFIILYLIILRTTGIS
jgi:hypothetical protein